MTSELTEMMFDGRAFHSLVVNKCCWKNTIPECVGHGCRI